MTHPPPPHTHTHKKYLNFLQPPIYIFATAFIRWLCMHLKPCQLRDKSFGYDQHDQFEPRTLAWQLTTLTMFLTLGNSKAVRNGLFPLLFLESQASIRPTGIRWSIAPTVPKITSDTISNSKGENLLGQTGFEPGSLAWQLRTLTMSLKS